MLNVRNIDVKDIVNLDLCTKSCTKLTYKQAINNITKKLYAVINGRKYDTVFKFSVKLKHLFTLPKDVEALFDLMYYTLLEDEEVDKMPSDISKYSKVLVDRIKKAKFSLENYFTFKYEFDLVVLSRSCSNEFYPFDAETGSFISMLYSFCCLIELVTMRTDKREVIGVDLEKNTIKYKSKGNVLFDTTTSVFKTEDEIKRSDAHIRITAINYGQTNHTVVVGEKEIFDIVDKVDDTYRTVKDTTIMMDMVSQKTGVKFADCSREMAEAMLQSNRSIIAEADTLRKRKHMTSAKGNLVIIDTEKSKYKSRVKSLLIKDIIVGNEPFIAVSYTLIDGHEGSLLFPLKFRAVMPSDLLECLISVCDFYGVSLEHVCTDLFTYENLPSYYWDYRKNGFISDEDTVKNGKVYRKYKEVQIGVHTAKMGNPSQEALELAKKYAIELKPGETIVRPHVRHYGKKEDEE